MNRICERVEANCPRCGAALVIPPSIRKRKIQCPKCRDIIAIGAPLLTAAESRAPTGEEFADLKARVAQHEALIEKLLARAAPPEEPAIAPPAGDSLLSPGTHLRWLRRDPDEAATAEVDAEQESVLLHNLRVMGQREVIVQSTIEDETAWNFGERLSALFRQAGWTVQGPDAAPESPRHRGLVLAAGNCPLPKSATATYMALKAAGFPIASRLDAALRPDESVLITGRSGSS